MFFFFIHLFPSLSFFFFFLNDPAPPEISPLPLHAALPIYRRGPPGGALDQRVPGGFGPARRQAPHGHRIDRRPPRGGLLPARGTPHPSGQVVVRDRKSTRLNSSHGYISYAVFCLKKKK